MQCHFNVVNEKNGITMNNVNISNVIKGKGMIRNTVALVAFLLMQFAPAVSFAQLFPQDPLTLEAYINDHKKQRSILLARATLEESNTILHKLSQATNRDYRDINIELDKYKRAFDIIDLVYQTASTGFNVLGTYNDVKDKIEKYRELIDEFNEKIVSRGRIESADTLLVNVTVRAVRDLADECENLYHHVIVIAGFCTGKIPCTTATLALMIENVNLSLDHIRAIVDSAYYRAYRFIQARTRLWKRELYRSKTVREMANEAFGRWQESWGGLDY